MTEVSDENCSEFARSLSLGFVHGPHGRAQDHVISRSALDKAVQQRVSQEQADREAILSLLQRSEVREIAAKAGLSLDRAQTAASILQGKDWSRPPSRRGRWRTIWRAARAR